MITLTPIDLPDIGMPSILPAIAPQEYENRLATAVDRMKERRLDALLVYGDREHAANMAFVTGLDPRFEEALLLVDHAGERLLIVGNEGMGYIPPRWPTDRVQLMGDLSLLGQPRDHAPSLRDVLSEFGVARGTKVGCVGWKYFGPGSVEGGPMAIEIPAYLVDLLRDMTSDRACVTNATDLFMDAQSGLRITNSVDQIAQFEYAACRVSASVWSVIGNLAVGISERELSRYLIADGLPLSCHPMLSFGEKVRQGLSSPSDNVARLGDAFTVAFGVWGALTCRAGAIARSADDLPADTGEFFVRMASNYFDVVACWYENVGVGARGGDVFDAVEARRDASLFDFAVNPGHSIGMDEWIHSPFHAGSDVRLTSGMALQMDIIPVSKGPFWYVNAEDGIALADASLRRQLADKHPQAWARITARQKFMRDTLNINIDDSVLPLSNYPAVLAPFLLKPNLVFAKTA